MNQAAATDSRTGGVEQVTAPDIARSAADERAFGHSTAEGGGPWQPIRLVYLAALHNSGSTVLALVAGAHPDIVSPGEMVGPGGRYHGAEGPACSCGQLVSACPFWLEVARRHRAQGHPWAPASWQLDFLFESHPLLSRLVFSHAGRHARRHRLAAHVPLMGKVVRRLRARNESFARCVLDVSRRRVIFDASKHPERLAHLSTISGLDLSVVHLVRDPRGWCNSRLKQPGRIVADCAAEWVRRNLYIERLSTRFPPERRLRVLYEDFCADPQAIMNAIFRLAGLPDSEVPADLRTISHHLLGNRMRTRGDAHIVCDESWRQALRAAQIRRIERATEKLARRYGYVFS